jgi:D-alanine-D-alanine ligase-like ATP-grasp enzyme
MNRKTKEAVQMGERYEATQTGLQYWDAVKVELETRRKAYETNLTKFKAQGGTGHVDTEHNMIHVELPGTMAEIYLDQDNKVERVVQDIRADSLGQLTELANAITAMFGLNKSDEAQRMVKELRGYLENDGTLSGMNSLANKTILGNPVLTALAMIPEDAKEKSEA